MALILLMVEWVSGSNFSNLKYLQNLDPHPDPLILQCHTDKTAGMAGPAVFDAEKTLIKPQPCSK